MSFVPLKALASAGAATLALAIASPAHSASESTIQASSGNCLTAGQQRSVHTATCNPQRPGQRWTITSLDNGASTIQTLGQCLDVHFNPELGSGQAYTGACDPGDLGQQWTITSVGNDASTIQAFGSCLTDASTARAFITTCHPQDQSQLWTIT